MRYCRLEINERSCFELGFELAWRLDRTKMLATCAQSFPPQVIQPRPPTLPFPLYSSTINIAVARLFCIVVVVFLVLLPHPSLA